MFNFKDTLNKIKIFLIIFQKKVKKVKALKKYQNIIQNRILFNNKKIQLTNKNKIKIFNNEYISNFNILNH